MANFKVAFSNGGVTSYTDEKSRFSITDGILTVYDGEGQRFQFSPSGWLCVEDAEPKSAYEIEDVKSF